MAKLAIYAGCMILINDDVWIHESTEYECVQIV